MLPTGGWKMGWLASEIVRHQCISHDDPLESWRRLTHQTSVSHFIFLLLFLLQFSNEFCVLGHCQEMAAVVDIRQSISSGNVCLTSLLDSVLDIEDVVDSSTKRTKKKQHLLGIKTPKRTGKRTFSAINSGCYSTKGYQLRAIDRGYTLGTFVQGFRCYPHFNISHHRY